LKELVCKDSRQTISENSGVITIPQECMVETPTKQIHASKDRNSIQRHAFQVEMQQPDVTIPQHEIVHTNTWNWDNQTTRINDGELDDVLKEAVSASQEFSSTQLTVLIISAMVLLVMFILGGLVIFKKVHRESTGQRQSTQTQEAVYESVELSEILKASPKTNIDQ
jgi:hypothetical protein